MRRWHEDYRITYREWREHHRSHVESNKRWTRNQPGRDPYDIDCDCDKQIGRFRKKDAWDCGNTQCGICHNDKFPRRTPHEQELMAELSFREQLVEMGLRTHGNFRRLWPDNVW